VRAEKGAIKLVMLSGIHYFIFFAKKALPDQ